MGLFLTSSLTSAVGPFIVLVAWLAASWYIMQMVQQLLFGARRSDLRYTDLLNTESVSLLILVLALLVLGLAPASLFSSDQTMHQTSAATESLIWNR